MRGRKEVGPLQHSQRSGGGGEYSEYSPAREKITPNDLMAERERIVTDDGSNEVAALMKGTNEGGNGKSSAPSVREKRVKEIERGRMGPKAICSTGR